MNEAGDTVFIGDLAELFSLEHALILTPNQRLAQQIQLQADYLKRQEGQNSWSARPVMAMSNWLQLVWDNATAAGHKPCNEYWVLSLAEELELWRSAMMASVDGELIAPESAAQQLMQAWHILCNWRVDIRSSTQRTKFQINDNCAFFLKVCERVLADSRAVGAVCAAEIPGLLADIESPLSENVLLYGFEEVLPAHGYLLRQWAIPHSSVQLNVNTSDGEQPLDVLRASTFEMEITAAAQWAHEVSSSDKNARVAVIVPQLENRRAQLEYCFESVFAVEARNPYSKRHVPPFNISAGVSLASTPLVQSALTLLNVFQRPIASAALPQLLYSPFFAHSYGTARAELYQLEHRLRGYGDPQLSIGAIAREAERLFASRNSSNADGNTCIELLLQTLSDGRRLVRDLASSTFDDHVSNLMQQLAVAGWPGDRSVDSVEYQQLSSFTKALSACHALAHLRFDSANKVSATESLALLEHALRTEVFQAQTSDTGVQVLGLLEGAGLPFTHVRLCDFSIGQWPANPGPSPYIPYAMQRDMRMPHCDALREADFSQRLFQRYQQQAGTLSCSYALDDGTTERLPSTMLRHLECNEVDIYEETPQEQIDGPKSIDESASSNTVADFLPVSKLEDIQGTTGLLTDQAACAFKAFTRHRLHVRQFESVRLGIDGRERGIILHDAMEAFWRSGAAQHTLNSETESELRDRVGEAVGTAIHSARRRLAGRQAQVFLGIEEVRLTKIVFDWLRNELLRSSFRVIDLEVAFATEIAGRPAQLRVDRVDLLEDGSLLLLEYKSGMINEKDTMQQPLLSPQLALYVLRYRSASGQQASGGAVCKIDDQLSTWMGVGKAKYVGMPLQRRLLKHEQDEALKDKLWAEQLQLWEQELERLEQSFTHGDARIDPAKGLATCRQCDYASICRYTIDGAGS
ncbi:MAG: PD-(D/E)XK nuclease family protein [Pseudomonadota bacterium]